MKARFYRLTFLLAMITFLFFKLLNFPIIKTAGGIRNDWVPVLFLVMVYVFALLAVSHLHTLQSPGRLVAGFVLLGGLLAITVVTTCFFFNWFPLVLPLKAWFLSVYLGSFILWLVFLSDIVLQKIKGF